MAAGHEVIHLAAAAIAAAFVLSAAWSTDDQAFLWEAIRGSLAEIDMGRLGPPALQQSWRWGFRQDAGRRPLCSERAGELACATGTAPPGTSIAQAAVELGLLLRRASWSRFDLG